MLCCTCCMEQAGWMHAPFAKESPTLKQRRRACDLVCTQKRKFATSEASSASALHL